jgi:hypothetical protein
VLNLNSCSACDWIGNHHRCCSHNWYRAIEQRWSLPALFLLAVCLASPANGQTDSGLTGASLRIEDDINDDGWLNASEHTGAVAVSFTLASDAASGDQLTISDGVTERVVVIDQAALESRVVNESFPSATDGAVIELTATYRNSDSEVLYISRDAVQVDLSAPEAAVVNILADADNSGFLSLQEYIDEPAVEIGLPASVAVNDRLEVRVGTRLEDIYLTPLDIANGSVQVASDVPAEGGTLSVLVKIFDEAGNTSVVASDSVIVDTIAPIPPTVDPLTTSGSTPVITGTASDDGDFILTVAVNDITYATSDSHLQQTGNGNWQLNIPPLDALPNGTYDVQVTVVDMAGNTSVDTTANELLVDLVAPQLSSANIGPLSDPAPLISGETDQPDASLVNVSTIGNVFVCQAVVADGQWSCRSRIMLSVGEHNLIATITDDVGNPGTSEMSVTVLDSSDQDRDGIPDDIEGVADADGDGIANYLDSDSDNDTIPDQVESAIDTDADQIRDFLDLDSDNDSLSDLYEYRQYLHMDADRDGAVDSAVVVGSNGLADAVESSIDSGESPLPVDSDNDGLFDTVDGDSDGDGVADRHEQRVGSTDSVETGLQQDEPLTLRDAVDTDGDGIADYRDLDSDQDGVADVVEALGIDSNHDGRLDDTTDVNKDGIADQREGISLASLDADQDGLDNRIDLDSDADGIFDLTESGGVDANQDGIHDIWRDENHNSINDSIDQAVSGGLDVDADLIDDRYDVDFTSGEDTDNDGVVDRFDADSDGNGRLDVLDDEPLALTDSNSDGVPDMFEPSEPVTVISTGTGALGTGCVLRAGNAVKGVDPTLLFMLCAAFAFAIKRRVSLLPR